MSARSTQHPGFCGVACRECERDAHERDQDELEPDLAAMFDHTYLHPHYDPDPDCRWCEERDR